MSFVKKMQSQGGKPSGFIGFLIGKLMNISHGSIYTWGLQNVSIKDTSVCLDIGCGGGKAVKLLAEKAINGKVYGLDHSLEMVNLAKRVNAFHISNASVEISQGMVSSLPYSDSYFDLITAFESVQFWPNLREDLQEIRRILKPSGVFLIINRYPPPDSKWSDFLQVKNAEGYKEKLTIAGFTEVSIDDVSRKGWILVKAKKDKYSLNNEHPETLQYL
jgi:ubiquinone/menaquinone biosynthesis C-methylase UbiE